MMTKMALSCRRRATLELRDIVNPMMRAFALLGRRAAKSDALQSAWSRM